MKKYVRYFPVDSEIRYGAKFRRSNNEIAVWNEKEEELANTAAVAWGKPLVAYLCSKEWKEGDEITLEDGTKREMDKIVAGFPKMKGEDNFEPRHNVIARISPQAYWIKEGDEFEDHQIRWLLMNDFGEEDQYCEFHELAETAEFDLILLQGPCGHFH